MKTNKRPFYVVSALLVIFIIPLIAAWWLVSHQKTIGAGTNNHGLLIQPPLPISQLTLTTNQQQPITGHHLQGKWLLVYVNPQAQCAKTCKKTLRQMRQIRRATGKDSTRVVRAIITFTSPNNSHSQLNRLLSTRYQGTLHLITSQNRFTRFASALPNKQQALTTGAIYLVDPKGNAMMTYNVGTNPSDIYKDLKKLLNVSQIG